MISSQDGTDERRPRAFFLPARERAARLLGGGFRVRRGGRRLGAGAPLVPALVRAGQSSAAASGSSKTSGRWGAGRDPFGIIEAVPDATGGRSGGGSRCAGRGSVGDAAGACDIAGRSGAAGRSETPGRSGTPGRSETAGAFGAPGRSETARALGAEPAAAAGTGTARRAAAKRGGTPDRAGAAHAAADTAPSRGASGVTVASPGMGAGSGGSSDSGSDSRAALSSSGSTCRRRGSKTHSATCSRPAGREGERDLPVAVAALA